jgi:hypothetical protein
LKCNSPGEGVKEGANGDLMLQTDEGEIACRYHDAAPGDVGVVWVFGAGGGFNGPAGAVYPRLAKRLASAESPRSNSHTAIRATLSQMSWTFLSEWRTWNRWAART